MKAAREGQDDEVTTGEEECKRASRVIHVEQVTDETIADHL